MGGGNRPSPVTAGLRRAQEKQTNSQGDNTVQVLGEIFSTIPRTGDHETIQGMFIVEKETYLQN